MKKIVVVILIAVSFSAMAQPPRYTVSNAHSHNDYEQKEPFWAAYNTGFGSIEADIFLIGGTLLVAHDTKELMANKRTLAQLYIEPLVQCLMKNHGYPYADTTRDLQMLIDIKSDSIHTLETLIQNLRTYDVIMNSKRLHWVITGNRPDPSLFTTYPSFITFDGVLSKQYTQEELSKIAMLSDEWKKYTSWYGPGELPRTDLKKIQAAVKKSEKLQKPVRFWGAPDTKAFWAMLMKWKAGYINTDHIPDLGNFLSQQTK